MFRDPDQSPNPTAHHNEIALSEISFEPEDSLWPPSLRADMQTLKRSVAICEQATRDAKAALARVRETLEKHPLESEVCQQLDDLRNDLNHTLAARPNQDAE